MLVKITRISQIGLLFFFLLMALRGFAQQADLHFNSLTVENGLPDNTVNAMLQDSRGYIWAGTNTGLVRYNGYAIKIYKLGDNNSYEFRSNSIYEGSDGIIWVIVNNGMLFRYSRNTDKFTLYDNDPSDSKSLSNKNVISVLDDQQDNVWINCYYQKEKETVHALVRYNKETNKRHYFSQAETGKQKIDAASFNVIHNDKSERLWLGTDHGLFQYDSVSESFIKYSLPANIKKQEVFKITEAPGDPGILWLTIGEKGSLTDERFNITYIFSIAKGIIRINTLDQSTTSYSHSTNDKYSLANDTVLTIYADSHDRIWAATTEGLSLFNPQTNTFTNYPTDKRSDIRSSVLIQEDQTGNLWYSSGFGGLSYFDTRSGEFFTYPANSNDPESLQSNWIRNILIDREGTLWVGTAGQGLQWVNKSRSLFKFYSGNRNGLIDYTGGKVIDFAESPGGIYWLATENGLYQWNEPLGSIRKISLPGIGATEINSRIVTTDKQGLVWGYWGAYGLFSYNPVTGRVKNFKNNKQDSTSLKNGTISTLMLDKSGTMWVASFEGWLSSYNPQQQNFIHYAAPAMLLDFYEDSDGIFWANTIDGLFQFDKSNGVFTAFNKDSEYLRKAGSIYQDKFKNYWTRTFDEGVYLFNNEGNLTRHFTERDGLLDDRVTGILEDGKGRIWLSGLRGLTIYDPDDKSLHHISLKNGLPDNQLNGGAYKTINGNFLIGCRRGFMEFNPNEFRSDLTKPLINVESIEFKTKNGNSKSERDSLVYTGNPTKISLRYFENRVSFNYAGLYYQFPTQTTYAYKLDGYDQDWIEAGYERKAIYTNLSPGTYRFYVKAASNDGVWSDQDSSITVVITPPWWKTWWAYLAYILVLGLFVYAFVRWRTKALKKEKNQLEEKVTERTAELKESLDNLKATQNQLIHTEKMASLGEVTAGIAHEIQNPLNFVTNFSEVSNELIDEIDEELGKGDIDEAREIVKDIKQNLEKINHHGNRASSIVKGMLQHSRTSTGQKELTDINALADEYLRLAYHGMRAKDKSFNADFKLDADAQLPKINVVPQDIGRVLLNLINNAFYAVDKKARKGIEGYSPEVTVSTRKHQHSTVIIVKDNGEGIPDNLKEKIFQPFFTTKPTGEGTGLGLSLSYDIITKGHGGELSVETKEGEGSEFTITIPSGQLK